MGRRAKEELATIKYTFQLTPRTLELMARYGGHSNLKKIASDVKNKKRK